MARRVISAAASTLRRKLTQGGAKALSPTGSSKVIKKEIAAQKELGTFLPDHAVEKQLGPFLPKDAYEGDIIRPRTDTHVLRDGSFMPDEAWKRLEQLKSQKPDVVRQMNVMKKRSSRQSRTRKNTENQVETNLRTATRQRRQATVVNGRLDGVEAKDTFFKSIGATGATLGRSMYKNLSEKGALKRAAIGTLQTSAVSAAASGGLAALNGDDPWEAAKTGAIRGALAGAGYQGLKAATHTTAGFGKGGMKQIGRGLKDTYGAHTVSGQAAIRQNGQMSNQLKRILMAGKDTKIAEQVLLK